MRIDPITETNFIEDTNTAADLQSKEDCANRQVSSGKRMKRFFWHAAARLFMLLCIITFKIANLLGRRQRQILSDEGCEIMLTGRFDSDNWILAHLGPLAASRECSIIWMVSTNPVPSLEKVKPIYPPKWLIKVIGTTQARILTFLIAAIRNKPHIVGGFHIMPNGIATAITGRVTGARSMYFCVGGPAEIIDGGVHSTDSYFTKMETTDTFVEQRLLGFVSQFDKVITMGTKAIDFFHNKGVRSSFNVISGGIDTTRFNKGTIPKVYDIILTGRLVEIKRIDIFLETVKFVSEKIPEVKSLIMGDGKLLSDLKQTAFELGISDNVFFAGHQNNIENWLHKSKIFVLTSDSEGLSLSMMEAMMCGLPVIVSKVGDLGDLVEDEVNGFLVPRRCPGEFANRIVELLTDENKLDSFSKAAHNAAMKYTLQAATEKWDNIIKNFRSA